MTLVESFSGIRGIYGIELTGEIIKKYALAYQEFLKKHTTSKPTIVIGRDTRPSGPTVLDTLSKTLDCNIIDLGILPTPIIEIAVPGFNADGGIIISGSHNEPEFNGLKLLDKDGAILRPNDIDFIIKRVHEMSNLDINNKDSKTTSREDKSNIDIKDIHGVITSSKQDNIINNKIVNKNREAIQAYKKLLKEILKTEKISGPKILVDPDGGAGIICKEIFDDFGVNAEYINMNPIEFNRLVEPNEQSLKYLEQEIKKRGCEFALGFDCDADRVEILLDDGSLASGNHILALITEEILSNSSEKTVVVNDATSYVVKEITERSQGIFKEVEVGEINVVDEMIKTNSPVGGEGSNGGVIIPPIKCRDGIITILLLLKIISKKNKSLKQLIKDLPYYYYKKEKFKVKDDFWNFRDRVRLYYISHGFQVQETGDKTGGLKALKENSWVWFRQSKTEDKTLRIIVDAKEKEIAESLLAEAKRLVL